MTHFRTSGPADLAVGPVILRVRDFEPVLAFYRGALGLAVERAPLPSDLLGPSISDDEAAGTHVLRAAAGSANQVAAERADSGKALSLIYLLANAQAQPAQPRTTGLYHLAFRVPDRQALGRFLRRILQRGVNLQGLSDHGVSEAIYLLDPAGNGVEVYADRPREAWPMSAGGLEMVTRPLNVEELLAAGREPAPLPAGTDLGHIHLKVNDLAAAEAFYCRGLGLTLMQRYGQGAIFVAAGGYHHHIGLNVWAGTGAPPPPQDAVGLVAFGLGLPSAAAVDAAAERLARLQVTIAPGEARVWAADPAGNRLWLEASAEVA